jgi:hypothetical protein
MPQRTPIRHGEILLLPVDSVPHGQTNQVTSCIVGHSESGHHHVLESGEAFEQIVAMVKKTGDIWRSWGWYVFERDGFRQPNEFGYGPDGYRMQIVTAGRPDYPPTLSASSPCFAGGIVRDDIPFPTVLQGN